MRYGRGYYKTVHSYFVGVCTQSDVQYNCYVRANWRTDDKCVFIVGDNSDESWYLHDRYSLNRGTPSHDRLRLLQGFVLENWWQIVTSCPLLPAL